MKEQRYKLSGLDCASCALAIETALDQVTGVNDCEVHEKESMLHVTFDETATSVEAIKIAVEDTGFDVEPITEPT